MTMIPMASVIDAPRSVRSVLVAALMMASVLTSFTSPVAYAESLEQALVRRFPPGAIGSVTFAREALSDVDAARREAEQTFAAERSRCFDKFFTASCLSDAKDVRRGVLSNIRKIEVEANAFLRKERAAERDRVIAERQGRATRPLEGPAIPITGAARDGGPAPDASGQPETPEKP